MTIWNVTAVMRPDVCARYADGSRVCLADMVTRVRARTDDLAVADDALTEAEWILALLWPGCVLVRILSCVVEERGDEVRTT